MPPVRVRSIEPINIFSCFWIICVSSRFFVLEGLPSKKAALSRVASVESVVTYDRFVFCFDFVFLIKSLSTWCPFGGKSG